jgi:transcriptional regulator with XRE-family HTH domain
MILSKEEKIKIGKCLKRLRTLLNETPEYIAIKLNINEKTISSWESGHLSDDSAIYVDYIYQKTKKYSGNRVPQYFKEHYWSRTVQDRILYYRTIGYAFYYSRHYILKKNMSTVSKETKLTERCIRDIEHNTYVGKEKIRTYANYIMNLTGNACNYKIAKIAAEEFIK